MSFETALHPAAVTALPGDPAWQDPALRRHLWARHLRAAVGLDAWKRAFAFAVVRNPWARLASCHRMCAAAAQRLHAPCPGRVPRLHRLRPARCDRSIGQDGGPQWSYASDERGRQIVDWVGRAEDMPAVVRRLADVVGAPVEIPHTNATQPVEYQTYYDDCTRVAVAQRFAVHIERFGYVF